MAARMLQDRDREIAARMFEDPFYSPPFLTPRNVRVSFAYFHIYLPFKLIRKYPVQNLFQFSLKH